MSINRIISTFGDHTSLYPLAVKDVVNSLGMTAYSYEEGGKDPEAKKIDAKDRFIDEFGTEAIWLGGLPFFKWLADKTIYKAKKFNPDIDVRLISNKEQLEVAKKYADKFSKELKTPEIADSLKYAEKNSKMFKGLFFGKFAAATALTLASYFTLTTLKQKYTEKQVYQRKIKQLKEHEKFKQSFGQNPTFKAFSLNNAEQNKSGKAAPSFKGNPVAGLLQSFMFNPVHNMFIVDAGITSERLYMARNKHEKMEYAIKEGSLLFFMYIAGKYVQQGIEAISEKFGKPIKLHAEFLTSDSLKKAMTADVKQKDNVYNQLNEFTNAVKDAVGNINNKKLYEFIYNPENAENLVVKAAKKSGIVSVIDESGKKLNGVQKFINIFKISSKPESGKVNPHQYINADDIKDLAKNIKNFADKQKTSGKSIEKFLESAKKFKVGSVAANIGICCLFLGFIVPYLMKQYKEKYFGEGSHIQDSIEKQIEQSFKGKIS